MIKIFRNLFKTKPSNITDKIVIQNNTAFIMFFGNFKLSYVKDLSDDLQNRIVFYSTFDFTQYIFDNYCNTVIIVIDGVRTISFVYCDANLINEIRADLYDKFGVSMILKENVLQPRPYYYISSFGMPSIRYESHEVVHYHELSEMRIKYLNDMKHNADMFDISLKFPDETIFNNTNILDI